MKKTMFIVLAAIPLSGSFCGREDDGTAVTPPSSPEPTVIVGPPSAAGDATIVHLPFDVEVTRTDAPDAGVIATPDPVDASEGAPSPRVWFVTPADGDVVDQRARYSLGVTGLHLVPRQMWTGPNEGHLYLLVDQACTAAGESIAPTGGSVVELSEGQDEAWLVLMPGPHTICAVVGDHDGRALGPSALIHVEVR